MRTQFSMQNGCVTPATEMYLCSMDIALFLPLQIIHVEKSKHVFREKRAVARRPLPSISRRVSGSLWSQWQCPFMICLDEQSASLALSLPGTRTWSSMKYNMIAKLHTSYCSRLWYPTAELSTRTPSHSPSFSVHIIAHISFLNPSFVTYG